MANGKWQMANGNGRWQMANGNGRWQMADGKSQFANRKSQIVNPMFTTLSNGRAGIRSLLQIEARSPSGAGSSDSPNSQVTGTGNVAEPSNNSILDFIVSDESLDRFGEVISASGWCLEAYRRNPVFQNAHQYGDILFTIVHTFYSPRYYLFTSDFLPIRWTYWSKAANAVTTAEKRDLNLSSQPLADFQLNSSIGQRRVKAVAQRVEG